MAKICIIGHFGFGKNMANGQTIKTKILYDELCNYYDKEDLICIDTHGKSLKKRVVLLFNIVNTMRTTPKIIIMLAKDGKRIFFPLLYWLNKIFKCQIYHDVIAGNLYDLLLKYPKWKKYLNSFAVNWVELESVSDKLKNAGVTNVEYLPNFKRIEIVNKKDYSTDSNKPLRFCMFSRVSKQKGIEDAIKVISDINSEYKNPVALLDIYGQIDKTYVGRFNSIIEKSPQEIKYKGEVQYSRSSEVLKNYYMLLFPTLHSSEGFPGTIIDAYSAGLPVIASNECELVVDNETGLIYSGFSSTLLKEKIMYAIKNSKEIERMRGNCIDKAWEYHPDRLIERIITKLEES